MQASFYLQIRKHSQALRSAHISSWKAYAPCSSFLLLNTPEKRQLMAQGIGSLSPSWETQIEVGFLALGWPNSQHLGNESADGISLSLISAFQINKQNFKNCTYIPAD